MSPKCDSMRTHTHSTQGPFICTHVGLNTESAKCWSSIWALLIFLFIFAALFFMLLKYCLIELI